MTEENKKSKYNIGNINSNNIVHFDSNFSGSSSGGIINIGFQEAFREISAEVESNEQELQPISPFLEKCRNILLLGHTGSGKSTLANVLTNTNNFKESPFSISQTRKIQTKEFIHRNQKYQVIDTIGISDTQLSQEEVLDQLLQAIYQTKNGIHQIFLVINGKLTKEEIATYHLLRDVFFTKDICKHITIVRTNFPDFQDQQKCEEDKEKIKQESKELSDIANSSPIIYVNSPPNDIQTRENSRQVLLTHLTNHPDIYKTTQLDELINQINNYLNKVERITIIETKLREAKSKPNNKEEIKRLEKNLKKTRQEKVITFQEIMKEIEKKKE